MIIPQGALGAACRGAAAGHVKGNTRPTEYRPGGSRNPLTGPRLCFVRCRQRS